MAHPPPVRMPMAFRILIFGIPLLTLTAIALGTQRIDIHLAMKAVLGQTDQCSVMQAIHASETLIDRAHRSEAIRASAVQLQSDGAYSLWHTRDGDFWIPARNVDVLPYNLAEQEQDVYGTGLTGVRSGDVVLDGGANVGVFTRKALNSGAHLVVAIEPAPENVESLRRTFSQEIQKGSVIVEAVGLWDTPGTLPLRVDAGNSARDSFVLNFGPAMSTVSVPLVTIDSLVENLNLPRVDFIKLDIEAAEKKAIAGAHKTMTRFHPRFAIAMEHLADDPTAIPEAINSAGVAYATICGPCLRDGAKVRPDALYFVPR